MKIKKLRQKLQNPNWVFKKLKRLYQNRENLADDFSVLVYDEEWCETVHRPAFLKNRRQIKFLKKIYKNNNLKI